MRCLSQMNYGTKLRMMNRHAFLHWWTAQHASAKAHRHSWLSYLAAPFAAHALSLYFSVWRCSSGFPSHASSVFLQAVIPLLLPFSSGKPVDEIAPAKDQVVS